MKRILIILFVLLSLSTYGQSGHICFKEIPVDGKDHDFVSALVDKGDSVIHVSPGIVALEGTMGGDSCNIFVLSSHKIVYEVVVSYRNKTQWNDLEKQYRYVKEKLQSKYGNPAECTESFKEKSDVSSDSAKFSSLLRDECNYKISYNLENGSIILSVEKYDDESGQVNLIYRDKKNYQGLEKTVSDDF